MQPEAPPQLAAPPKLSAAGLAAIMAQPHWPSILTTASSAAPAHPVASPEIAAHAPLLNRPTSRRAKRRARGKAKEDRNDSAALSR